MAAPERTPKNFWVFVSIILIFCMGLVPLQDVLFQSDVNFNQFSGTNINTLQASNLVYTGQSASTPGLIYSNGPNGQMILTPSPTGGGGSFGGWAVPDGSTIISNASAGTWSVVPAAITNGVNAALTLLNSATSNAGVAQINATNAALLVTLTSSSNAAIAQLGATNTALLVTISTGSNAIANSLAATNTALLATLAASSNQFVANGTATTNWASAFFQPLSAILTALSLNNASTLTNIPVTAVTTNGGLNGWFHSQSNNASIWTLNAGALTNLNASQLLSGTLPVGVIPFATITNTVNLVASNATYLAGATISNWATAAFQPLATVLTSLAGLANGPGVLTNNGTGTLSWVAVGGGSSFNGWAVPDGTTIKTNTSAGTWSVVQGGVTNNGVNFTNINASNINGGPFLVSLITNTPGTNRYYDNVGRFEVDTNFNLLGTFEVSGTNAASGQVLTAINGTGSVAFRPIPPYDSPLPDGTTIISNSAAGTWSTGTNGQFRTVTVNVGMTNTAAVEVLTNANLPQTSISVTGSNSGFAQVYLQNTASNVGASMDLVFGWDNSNPTSVSNYFDIGMNSSNFTGFFGNAHDAYIYNIGPANGQPDPANGANLRLGTANTNSVVSINVAQGTNNTTPQYVFNSNTLNFNTVFPVGQFGFTNTSTTAPSFSFGVNSSGTFSNMTTSNMTVTGTFTLAGATWLVNLGVTNGPLIVAGISSSNTVLTNGSGILSNGVSVYTNANGNVTVTSLTNTASNAGIDSTGLVSGNGMGLQNVHQYFQSSFSETTSSTAHFAPFQGYTAIATTASGNVSNIYYGVVTLTNCSICTNTGLSVGSNYSYTLYTNGNNGTGAFASSGVSINVGLSGVTNWTGLIRLTNTAPVWRFILSGAGSFTEAASILSQ